MEQMEERVGFSGATRVLVTLASFIVVVAGLRAASSVLVPLLLAAFIAVICTVPLAWLQRKGVPDVLAVALITLGILAFGLLLVVLVGVSLNRFIRELPQYQERLSTQTTAVFDWLRANGVNVSREAFRQYLDLGKAMSLAGDMVSGLGSALADGFFILMTVVFILLEASGFPRKLRAAFHDPERSLAGWRQFSEGARRYLLIKALISVATGALIGIWLLILGVGYPELWGFLAFLLNFVPYVGSFIAAIPAVLVALAQLGMGPALLAALGYVVVNFVLGNIVEPRVMGAQLSLSPLVVFTSLAFWGWILGPVGMVLSVPLTMLLRIALEGSDDTRWIATMLGPGPSGKPR